MIVTYPVGARWIWRRFMDTVGPRPVLFVWLLLLAVGLAGVVGELRRRRRGAMGPPEIPEPSAPLEPAEPLEPPEPPAPLEPARRDVAAFAALTLAAAPVAMWIFLERLGYPPRPWYFLPLMAILASALDTVFGFLCGPGGGRRRRALRRLRIAAVAVVAAAQLLPLSQRLGARQSNADLVAATVAAAAAPRDLVVVVPWYYGVSFARYYHGAARWLTLPVVEDHRFHRYDLLKPKLAAAHPLDDLLLAVAATLRGGGRVWVVGAARWPPPAEAATLRPPAPRSAAGWHDYPYIVDWSRQLGRFLQLHARVAAAVATAASGPVSDLEDMQLAVLQGWR